MAASVSVTLPALRVAGSSEFTVARLREFITTELSDSALQVLLDDATDAIADVLGPATVRERLPAVSGDVLMLSRVADEVVTIVEDAGRTSVTLAVDDWELSGSGQTLYRLRTGTHPASGWRGRIDVTYVRGDDAAARTRVTVELVALSLNTNPGLESQRIGEWQESYRTNSDAVAQRDAILATLSRAGEGFVW